jgi:hypothetical protein
MTKREFEMTKRGIRNEKKWGLEMTEKEVFEMTQRGFDRNEKNRVKMD